MKTEDVYMHYEEMRCEFFNEHYRKGVTGIMILSRLVDTFSSRILYPMLLLSGNHSIAVV